MWTKNSFLALTKKHGDNNLMAVGINDVAGVTYFVGTFEKFTEDMLIEEDGQCLIKTGVKLPNKKTGKHDIEATIYHNMEDVQSVLFINNEEDLENLNMNDFYVLY